MCIIYHLFADIGNIKPNWLSHTCVDFFGRKRFIYIVVVQVRCEDGFICGILKSLKNFMVEAWDEDLVSHLMLVQKWKDGGDDARVFFFDFNVDSNFVFA